MYSYAICITYNMDTGLLPIVMWSPSLRFNSDLYYKFVFFIGIHRSNSQQPVPSS